ncbi:LPS assembly lipoprotein LptE [Fretibacter rubidus]|uniref:LPS assembly lipoprotein LptE n=1 Tax=Fretibacter rubidus TaxID=570162 RepID=UPI00352A9A62
MTTLRATILAFIALTLTACGFTPMHAPAGLSDAAFNNVRIELAAGIPVQDKEAAFWVQQALKTRLGNGDSAKHILRVKPEANRAGIGISGVDVATRYDLGLNVSYELIDMKSGKLLDSGSVKAISTIAASTDPYALTAAEKATVRNLASDGADRVLVRLAGYYANAAQ